MARRKSISKKVRFDIFKRDGFTCAYCGRQPPATVLHLDHILAVANGGSNDDTNLITSCVDCNLGKGTGELSAKLPTLQEAAERKRELKEQLEEFASYAQQLRKLEDEHVESAIQYFFQTLHTDDRSGWTFVGQTRQSFQCFIQRLPLHELFDAVDKTVRRLGMIPAGSKNDGNHFKYFCGVCWRKIKEPAKP